MESLDQTLQEYVDELAEDSSISIAQFSFSPSKGAVVLRFCESDNLLLWSEVNEAYLKIIENGRVVSYEKAINIDGENFILLVDAKDDPLRSPYSIAIVDQDADLYKVKARLDHLAQRCVGEIYSPKWK